MKILIIIFIFVIIISILFYLIQSDKFKMKKLQIDLFFDINKRKPNDNIPIVYKFKLGYGGIGDFIKFMELCIKKSKIMNTKFYINLDHPMKEFIQIKDKYIFNPHKTKIYETIKPFTFYNKFDKNSFINKKIIFNPLQYFTFSKECLDNCSNLLLKNNINNNYEGIHLRMGDSKMNSTKKNQFDNRVKNLNFHDTIDKIVSSKIDTIFLLFTDNKQIKTEIFEKFDNIRILNIEIIHTSDCYNNKFQKNLKDNISEFVLLSKAKKIHSISYSGYPIVASWIYSNPLVKYY